MSDKSPPSETACPSGLFQKSSPSRLRLFLAATALFSLITAVVSLLCTGEHYRAVQTIGLDAAPSVVLAHRIKTGTEAMDAALVDELLSSEPRGQLRLSCQDDFESNRIYVARSLIAAARNITFGNTELSPVENMQQAMGTWLMQAQAARQYHRESKNSDALLLYRCSLSTLQQTLLPAADSLEKANAEKLESAYALHRTMTGAATAAMLSATGVLTAILIYAQVYLAAHFRRRFNPYLVAASVISCAFGVLSVWAYHDCSANLKKAKVDAYDSIIALLEARSDSYEANAAESRWLLDPKNKATHAQCFFDKTSLVAKLEPGSTFEQLVKAASAQFIGNQTIQISRVHGALAGELNNITFAGEAEAAVDALRKFAVYYALDGKVRQLENDGNHEEAVCFCLSDSVGGSNWAFNEYDNALAKVLDINEKRLKNYLDDASGNLENLTLLALIVPLLTTLAACLGIRPRLKEY
jgi:hypothetical protein